MYVLGVSCFYHDSAACLLKDGKIIAAAEEERFTRKKHDNRFPQNAIEFCLDQAGIKIEEVEAVAFYEKPFIKFERILYNSLATFPKSYWWFVKAIPGWLKEKLWFKHVLKKQVGYKGEVYFCDHHLSHAASSYYASSFKECAYLTADGVGEWSTTTLGKFVEGKPEVLAEIKYPHSLGLLYSVFTGFLGFRVNNGEYKVMGLASYGEPKYKDLIYKHLLEVRPDGSFQFNMDYFAYHYSFVGYNWRFVELFGLPIEPEADFNQRAADLAASVQAVVEELLLKQLDHLYSLYPSENLCMAGGVALNCVANSRVLKESKFKNLYIQPAAGDAGGAVGAAYYIDNLLAEKNGETRTDSKWGMPYWGSSGLVYNGHAVEEFLEKNDIKSKRFGTDTELIDAVADFIADNKVIGWFQGRQEFGPRALGNRSILANPMCKDMQDILNMKIKKREKFRPFAPAVLLESAEEYFDMVAKDCPYMLLIADVKEAFSDKLPAITHVDGTARLQTVAEEMSPRYHAVIKAVGQRTGVDMVVNTSFNVRGEPIVRTPEEAYNCFMTTDMDVLVLGDFLIVKE